MGDGDASLRIVLDVLHQEVGIRLTPIAARAGMTGRTAQIATVGFIACITNVSLRHPTLSPPLVFEQRTHH
jgi:hypothetical protein